MSDSNSSNHKNTSNHLHHHRNIIKSSIFVAGERARGIHPKTLNPKLLNPKPLNPKPFIEGLLLTIALRCGFRVLALGLRLLSEGLGF